MERRLVHYSGHVQGVGFRYSTRSIASQFEVTGFVRNLCDGRVELVVEGGAAEIETFLDALQSAKAQFIKEINVERGLATGQFKRFEIQV